MRRPMLVIHHVMVVGIGFALMTACEPNLVATQQSQSRPPASEQIETILGEKAGRTPAQQKISSRLLYALKEIRRGDADPSRASSLRSSVKVDADGTTLVDIKAEVTDAVLARIEAFGGTVINSFTQHQAIRARTIRLGESSAHMRCGFRWDVDVAYDNIERLDSYSQSDTQKERIDLIPFGTPAYLLHLRRPVEAVGVYGLRRRVQQIGFSVDDMPAFRKCLEERLHDNRCSDG